MVSDFTEAQAFNFQNSVLYLKRNKKLTMLICIHDHNILVRIKPQKH